MSKNFFSKKYSRGVALYIAITVTGALILIAFAIIELALKQVAISSAGRDSEEAFYAADSAAECALYYDVKTPTIPGVSPFSTTTVQNITCDNQLITPVHNTDAITGVGTTTFSVNATNLCAVVGVTKNYVGTTLKTKIESKGYNTCDFTAFQRVERAIRISY